MTQTHLLNPRLPTLWHGGDYSPEQWPSAIWDEDVRLMQEARFKVATLGVFSWVRLEPSEGNYQFGWLDEVIEKLSAGDRYFMLATPSAAPPAWMGRKYPEILRTGSDRVRRLHGNRVNYNLCSPVYREKARAIAQKLGERYGDHPRLLAWHISNEYGGDDFGAESLAAFRIWLQAKYGTLEALNGAYWTAFWSHEYTDWEEIDAPGQPYAETAIQGLTVDWQRFTTDSTISFMLNEIEPLRAIAPSVPVTTNFMGTYGGLNYRRFSEHLDFTCWDSYPAFGGPLTEINTWVQVAFKHDLSRCLSKNRSWMLMECTPSSSNWYGSMALKKPGVHRFEALQAVAHGADGVQYFQWRQSRGSQEQFHGAVVGHVGSDQDRVFCDVREAGMDIDDLSEVAGSQVKAEVAIVFDWESRWALDAACGPVQRNKGYEATCIEHYKVFWQAGIPVDIVGQDDDLESYRVVVAPMAYSLRPGFAERVKLYVEGGGTFVTTYLSGWTDENSLVFEGGFLGPLREVLGVWSEEIDALDAGQSNQVHVCGMGIDALYQASEFCELVHVDTAHVLGTYQFDFYSGYPALTVNNVGSGLAYYVASRNDGAFLHDFLREISREAGVTPVMEQLPEGVTAQVRTGASKEWVFLLNATAKTQIIPTAEWGEIDLPAWGVSILPRVLS